MCAMPYRYFFFVCAWKIMTFFMCFVKSKGPELSTQMLSFLSTGTYLNTNDPYGSKACVNCGPGLTRC